MHQLHLFGRLRPLRRWSTGGKLLSPECLIGAGLLILDIVCLGLNFDCPIVTDKCKRTVVRDTKALTKKLPRLTEINTFRMYLGKRWSLKYSRNFGVVKFFTFQFLFHTRKLSQVELSTRRKSHPVVMSYTSRA